MKSFLGSTFPQAEKLISISGPRARQYADLLLHHHDLDFAKSCVEKIKIPKGPDVIAEALWQASILNFIKCFGSNASRTQLSADKIFKKGVQGSLDVFNYFKSLRNKHIAHDENAWVGVMVGAVLNKPGSAQMVETVTFQVFGYPTLNIKNRDNLKLLLAVELAYVESSIENEAVAIREELETHSFEELVQRDSPTHTVPHMDEIHEKRQVN